MNAIKQLLSDGTGSLSTMRVCVMLVVAAVLFNWCYLTIKNGVAQPLDWTTVTMVVGALGFKSVQSAFEKDPTPPTPPVAKPPGSP